MTVVSYCFLYWSEIYNG